MLDPLLDNFRTLMIVGIIVVVGLGQVNRVIGSVLGLFFWAFIAFLGGQIYARGGAVGIVDIIFPPAVFYGLCGFMGLVNLFSLRMGLIHRRHARRRL